MKISYRIKDGWTTGQNKSLKHCDKCGDPLWIAPHGGVYCDREHTPERLKIKNKKII